MASQHPKHILTYKHTRKHTRAHAHARRPSHPLAGQTVRLEVEICALRPATDEEIDAAQAEISERIAYEGAIDHPEPDAVWRIVERFGVTGLFTSPTAVRALMRTAHVCAVSRIDQPKTEFRQNLDRIRYRIR